jgi:hypothetical protein
MAMLWYWGFLNHGIAFIVFAFHEKNMDPLATMTAFALCITQGYFWLEAEDIVGG